MNVTKTAPATASELQKIVGRNTRRLRLARGFSRRDLAQASGLSRGYVGQIENGRANLRATTLGAIADALGVAPADLLTL
ncbi:MAG: helix-turn-helix transcriptional regulator [Phenylobacterium sp.]|nr:helix-turn-helix transcriptional regulator [Phenylobacterium sp.]